MCVTFFTLAQPGFKLILAFNRDEFFDRPTLPADWHNFAPSPTANGSATPLTPTVLSGLDRGKAEGGTWLGISRNLKVGLLTNIVRYPAEDGIKPLSPPPSRGKLLREFLLPSSSSQAPSSGDVQSYISSHLPTAGNYEGFNLLLFSLSPSLPSPSVGYLTNRPKPASLNLDHLSRKTGEDRGCTGLSNGPLETVDKWPKVESGEGRMGQTLKEWEEKEEGVDALVERMYDVLSPTIPVHSDDDLLHTTTVQPVKLSPQMTIIPSSASSSSQGRWKGTRTATVILVHDNGKVVYVERDIWELGENGDPQKGNGERRFEFSGDVE
ncbi:hypothetical protein L198_01136 [Cryptococcus wingfieldii CBS 7118]|uniref:DUF833-domain-containing protein n=1 Tax=Cryptococcus wingfieldii CBS 7118 TaxID=1295528 RepID=A0A1E3K4X4_9TREE|nr:hypothetical protein L198_01136 [Cryptococcus wingfieldii CBS 7118]ODO07557.1 hypothetical protein L198_01136 [Cryptococcus wingfieldii CBS 7118]